MLYSDSLCEMMQNAVNESFWDAHGVEIGPCALFEHFARSGKISPEGNFFLDWMLWVSTELPPELTPGFELQTDNPCIMCAHEPPRRRMEPTWGLAGPDGPIDAQVELTWPSC